ncbi:Palmitoyltransferase zdhhc2 [Coemansia sp. RSA 1199]|nr:Palmitoyltransferase zdhhc2 [Coemansia sp. RSA 1199]
MNRHQIYRVLGFFPVLFTLALFGWSQYVYLTSVVPLMHEQGTKRTIAWTVVELVVLGLALWSYAVCVARNPGNPVVRNPTVFSHGGTTPYMRLATAAHAPTVRQRSGSVSSSVSDPASDSDSSCDNAVLTTEQLRQTQLIHTLTVRDNGQPRFCLKCNVPKPDRAHHCSTCNVCVLKMDHHCPWLNNCVGFRTQKAFVLFLVYSALYCALMFETTLIYYVMYIMGLPADFQFELAPFFMMLMAFAFALSLLGFGGFHVYLLLINKTTIESYDGNTFRHALGKRTNLFNLGYRRNFRQVFGRSRLAWFVPTFTSLGDGIKYSVDYDSYDMTLQPSDFTLLQQCAELLDLCVDNEDSRAELVRRMEAITQHMDHLRTTIASLPGISISQQDQKKVLAECQTELDEKLTKLSEYSQTHA